MILPGIRVMHTPIHTPGGMTVFIDTAKGRAAITGFCVIKEIFLPPIRIRAMEMEIILPGTHRTDELFYPNPRSEVP